jgi:hypothetical protein
VEGQGPQLPTTVHLDFLSNGHDSRENKRRIIVDQRMDCGIFYSQISTRRS